MVNVSARVDFYLLERQTRACSYAQGGNRERSKRVLQLGRGRERATMDGGSGGGGLCSPCVWWGGPAVPAAVCRWALALGVGRVGVYNHHSLRAEGGERQRKEGKAKYRPAAERAAGAAGGGGLGCSVRPYVRSYVLTYRSPRPYTRGRKVLRLTDQIVKTKLVSVCR